MLTNNYTQYEPPQMKLGQLGRRVSLLTAGEIHIHSEALREAQKDIQSLPTEDVQQIAEIYAANVRAVKLRMAAQLHLAAYGLDEISFLARQRDMSPELVMDLANKMERYSLEIEALIVGLDGNGKPGIYHIDEKGVATNHTDIGFMTIGSGGPHARLQFMSAGYSQYNSNYYMSLTMSYFAKKSAEVSPGVGTSTDIVLITRDRSDVIEDQLKDKLQEIYEWFTGERKKIALGAIQKVTDLLEAKEQDVPASVPEDLPS